jgi:hypothetical protein
MTVSASTVVSCGFGNQNYTNTVGLRKQGQSIWKQSPRERILEAFVYKEAVCYCKTVHVTKA